MANDKTPYDRHQEFLAMERRIEKGRRIRTGCRCDVCGTKQANDPHEIFPRSLTGNDSYNRQLCYSKYVISWLCRDCHHKYQNDPVVNQELLAMNRDFFWIRSEVDKHLNEMREAGIHVGFQNRTTE